MLCPVCHSDSPRRSRRRGVKDYLVGATLLRPWRCRGCDARFYAWSAPIAYVRFVHCGICGNMDLRRISSEHGIGAFAWLFRLLRFPTYRCAPCRNRFFSIRPFRRIVATAASDRDRGRNRIRRALGSIVPPQPEMWWIDFLWRWSYDVKGDGVRRITAVLFAGQMMTPDKDLVAGSCVRQRSR